jgi:hypothetical protein
VAGEKARRFNYRLRRDKAYQALTEAIGSPTVSEGHVEWQSNPFGYPDLEVWVTPSTDGIIVQARMTRGRGGVFSRAPAFEDLTTMYSWLKVEGWI